LGFNPWVWEIWLESIWTLPIIVYNTNTSRNEATENRKHWGQEPSHVGGIQFFPAFKPVSTCIRLFSGCFQTQIPAHGALHFLHRGWAFKAPALIRVFLQKQKHWAQEP
jgi:hypothetical protein